MKMVKAVARRWVKALESGKYKQTSSNLCTRYDKTKKPSYCCLGVLARVQGAKFKFDDSGLGYLYYKNNSFSGYLPVDSDLLAGLSDVEQKEFGTMNDMRGMNFKQIANEIRIRVLGQKGRKKDYAL